MLGIPDVTWFANPAVVFGNQVVAAASAVFSGLCQTVLCYHTSYRLGWNTPRALEDPFRRSAGGAVVRPGSGGVGPDTIANAAAYTAWASRYLHDFDGSREDLGLVALNGRANAATNPAAAKREPLTMGDYLAAPMIRWPLCLLDMDLPVDGADAFVITTAERARDLPLPPVLVHGATLGMVDLHVEDQAVGLERHGQHVVVDALRAQSDLWLDDIDVFLPYDGFTIITLNWFENLGFCGRGEAGQFLRSHWDDVSGRVLIDGRAPVNPHGGSLSEGASQGAGHVREAVHQLQGRAGERQVDGASSALVTPGGFFFNSQGLILRRQ
jgi:acetyl-CoA acetyltransferase